MVEVTKSQFMGVEAYEITNGRVKLIVATGVGPRIIHFGFCHKGNVLRVSEMDFMNRSNAYKFYGGHRLWHAPEHSTRSYLPDNAPCEVGVLSDGIETIVFEADTKVERHMTIQMKDNGRVRIIHKLINRSLFDISMACWGITQMKPGGVAVMPTSTRKTGFLPNRSVAFWEYSNMGDRRAIYLPTQILVRQDESIEEKFKIGSFNDEGYLAYFNDGDLFVKEFDVADGECVDYGCNSEIFVSGEFLEIESLSDVRLLTEDEAISHTEVWELFEKVSSPALEMPETVDMKDYVNA